MPFTTTQVIPDDWSAHHQSVATGGMTAACTIADPSRETVPPFDPETGTQPAPVPFAVYDGPCRVQEVDSATSAMQAGQDVTARRYLVAIQADADRIEQGWPVTITAARNDAHLVGQTLYVADVQSGSERFERDLICTANQG